MICTNEWENFLDSAGNAPPKEYYIFLLKQTNEMHTSG